MLLAIDIGNTNITFGIFKGRSLKRSFNIPTQDYALSKLRQKLGRLKISDAVVCSVVPKACVLLGRDIQKLFGRRPYIIGKDIVVPIKNRYRNPRQVGQDRLVNAYAAISLYGAPIIAVDFGTAITFDIISKNNEYLGGVILPGLGISLEALAQKTALLPKIKLARPSELIAKDTKNSMLSGIVYGFASLADGLVLKIKNKIGRHAKVIGTGGGVGLMAKYCRSLDRIDPELTLKGLNLIYRNKIRCYKKNT